MRDTEASNDSLMLAVITDFTISLYWGNLHNKRELTACCVKLVSDYTSIIKLLPEP